MSDKKVKVQRSIPVNGYSFDERCRECKHTNAWHVGPYGRKVVLCEANYYFLDNLTYRPCKCPEFIPTDNLKYL
jgi:hypothetical protein